LNHGRREALCAHGRPVALHIAPAEDFATLLGGKGVGPATVRALSLMAELVYNAPASHRDPASATKRPPVLQPGSTELADVRRWADYSCAQWRQGRDAVPGRPRDPPPRHPPTGARNRTPDPSWNADPPAWHLGISNENHALQSRRWSDAARFTASDRRRPHSDTALTKARRGVRGRAVSLDCRATRAASETYIVTGNSCASFWLFTG
jgi:hypothetical protein